MASLSRNLLGDLGVLARRSPETKQSIHRTVFAVLRSPVMALIIHSRRDAKDAEKG
jgi:hypothetical protein